MAKNVAQSVSIEQLEKDDFFPEDSRKLEEAFQPGEGQDALGATFSGHRKEQDQVDVGTPGLQTQILWLFYRELKNLFRDTTAVGARFGSTIFLSCLVGALFFDVGSSDSSVPTNLQSHFGALIMVGLMSMFGTAEPALLSFPDERPVFLREYSTNHYSVVSYFISRLSMEAFLTGLQVLVLLAITFYMINLQGSFEMFFVSVYSLAMGSTAVSVMLGCSVEDPKLAQEMLPLLFVPQMLFAGFFIIPELIPYWLRWARYLCSLTYAIRILLVEEFGNCNSIGCVKLLDDIEADPDQIWWNWIVLVVLFVLCRTAALLILREKATKFY